MPSEIGFPMTCQAADFSTKNPINQPAMNNRRILKTAVLHFVHPVQKESWKSFQMLHKFSARTHLSNFDQCAGASLHHVVHVLSLSS